MGDDCGEQVGVFILFGGCIALISCGLSIAQPNLHGVKFQPGLCKITHATSLYFWEDLPRCSCGKNCGEEYPCPKVFGTFSSNTSDNTIDNGEFFHNYLAFKQKCLVVPKCSSKYINNARRVYYYYVEIIFPKVNNDTRYPYWGNVSMDTNITYTNSSFFPCYGHDAFMYFENNYSILNVCLSLAIPSVVVVFGAYLAFKNDSEFIVCLVCLPFLMVRAVFRKCYKCYKRTTTTRAQSPDLRTESYSDREAARRRRSASLPSIMLATDASLSMGMPTPVLRRSRRRSTESITLPRLALFSAAERRPSIDTCGSIELGGAINLPPSYDRSVLGTDAMPPPPSYDDVMGTS